MPRAGTTVSVVQSLECHTGSDRRIADYGDVVFLRISFGLIGHSHTQGGGNGSGAVPRSKGIVRAFLAGGEARNAAGFPQPGKGFPSACQDLMGVGLVTYVPDHRLVRRIEYVVQGNGQFHYAEVRPQMSLFDRYHVDNVIAQLISQIIQLIYRQPPEIGGIVHRKQQGVFIMVCSVQSVLFFDRGDVPQRDKVSK